MILIDIGVEAVLPEPVREFQHSVCMTTAFVRIGNEYFRGIVHSMLFLVNSSDMQQ